MQVVKIGDEFFTFIVDCKEPKACSIVLRGASKDILNEVGVSLKLKKGLVKENKMSGNQTNTSRLPN